MQDDKNGPVAIFIHIVLPTGKVINLLKYKDVVFFI